MNDYISRQAAIDGYCKADCGINYGVCEYKDCFEIRFLKKLPSEDVVEVVRCRECKWQDKRPGVTDCHNPVFGDGYANYAPPCMREDDFCSRGERRTDGEIY